MFNVIEQDACAFIKIFFIRHSILRDFLKNRFQFDFSLRNTEITLLEDNIKLIQNQSSLICIFWVKFNRRHDIVFQDFLVFLVAK